MKLFDRALVRARRRRWTAQAGGCGFLFREVAERLADRLDDVKRRFPTALDLGCRDGVLGRALKGRGGIETLIGADGAVELVRCAGGVCRALAADEEALPFAAGSFDLVLSSLALHWANDLPGALIQIRESLRPDGLFLGALFGLGTLAELRESLLAAEAETAGGAGPRVSPFADLRDAAGLLQRAGFALPVADADSIVVTYADALALMGDLRAMGEANALLARPRRPLRRDTLMRAAEIYAKRFPAPDGRVSATFRIVYLTGWAPHAAQPKALAPGSAKARLAAALGTEEREAGDKARPGKG